MMMLLLHVKCDNNPTWNTLISYADDKSLRHQSGDENIVFAMYMANPMGWDGGCGYALRSAT